MKDIYHKFMIAFQIGRWAFNNPQVLESSNFKMLSDILILILKVAKEQQPLMTKIAHIHPDTKEQSDIVTIWAGSGIGADPYKRIEELRKENSLLKAHLESNLSQHKINNP